MLNKVSKTIEGRLKIKNVAFFYQIAKIFNLSKLHKAALSYIERCFTMLVETQNFLELDFNFVSNILTSSELSITSEGEVYCAAENWLIYSIKERSQFAKQLLETVRLTLVSDETLKYFINNPSPFSEIAKTKGILKEVLNNKDNYYQNKSSAYYTSRYCNQALFNILVCGGRNENYTPVKIVKQLNANNFKSTNVLSSMIDNRVFSQAVCLKGEVYVFGGYDDNNKWIRSVEKYSPLNNSWIKVADICDERRSFCACAFMDKIFIIGGYIIRYSGTIMYNPCLQFGTKDYKFKEVAEMNEARLGAACVLFDDRLIVSGGEDNRWGKLNTVESYDVAADIWTQMPNMIERRCAHSLVVVKSKLFVIGGNTTVTSEVFDKKSKMFVTLKSPRAIGYNISLSIGNKIIIFENDKSNYSVITYDIYNDKWSDQSYESIGKLFYYSCVKLPIY